MEHDLTKKSGNVKTYNL